MKGKDHNDLSVVVNGENLTLHFEYEYQLPDDDDRAYTILDIIPNIEHGQLYADFEVIGTHTVEDEVFDNDFSRDLPVEMSVGFTGNVYNGANLDDVPDLIDSLVQKLQTTDEIVIDFICGVDEDLSYTNEDTMYDDVEADKAKELWYDVARDEVKNTFANDVKLKAKVTLLR